MTDYFLTLTYQPLLLNDYFIHIFYHLILKRKKRREIENLQDGVKVLSNAFDVVLVSIVHALERSESSVHLTINGVQLSL